MVRAGRFLALRFLGLALGAAFFFAAFFFLLFRRVVISLSGWRIFAISFSRALRRCAMLLAIASSSMRIRNRLCALPVSRKTAFSVYGDERRKHRVKHRKYCTVFATIKAMGSNIRRNLPLLRMGATAHLS